MPWPDSKNNYKNQNSDTHKNKKEEAMEIRTSAPDCFSHMAQAYKNKDNFFVIDDARTGINPAYSTLLDMGKQAGLAPRQWIGVLSSLGLAGAGLWLARTAVLDPEPTSKLSLLLCGGVVCLAAGGLSAIRILTGQIPPNVSVSSQGFDIRW